MIALVVTFVVVAIFVSHFGIEVAVTPEGKLRPRIVKQQWFKDELLKQEIESVKEQIKNDIFYAALTRDAAERRRRLFG